MERGGERWLRAAKAAAKLGVTVKARRVFERERLIAPGRSAAGWRGYGGAEIARLHRIVVLRDLGLPLKAMRPLLDPRPPAARRGAAPHGRRRDPRYR